MKSMYIWVLLRPEEGVKFSEAVVTGDCKLPYVNKDIHTYLKNSKST